MEPRTYRKTALTQAMYSSPEQQESRDALQAWGAVLRASLTSPVGWAINTKEGWRDLAHKDGVVCRGPDGEFYESDRDIFRRNYEEVPQ